MHNFLENRGWAWGHESNEIRIQNNCKLECLVSFRQNIGKNIISNNMNIDKNKQLRSFGTPYMCVVTSISLSPSPWKQGCHNSYMYI